MSVYEQYRYKIYDETASLIADLYFKEQISEQEMSFLLNILESVVIKKDNTDFIDILRKWVNEEKNTDLDKIIKEKLLTIDFSDQNSVNSESEIVKNLIKDK